MVLQKCCVTHVKDTNVLQHEKNIPRKKYYKQASETCLLRQQLFRAIFLCKRPYRVQFRWRLSPFQELCPRMWPTGFLVALTS